jgi:hypothetical protein
VGGRNYKRFNRERNVDSPRLWTEDGRAATTDGDPTPLQVAGGGLEEGGGVGGILARNVPDLSAQGTERMSPYDRGAPDPHSRGGSRWQEGGLSVGEDTHSTPLHL